LPASGLPAVTAVGAGWCSAFLSGIDHWLGDPAQRNGAIRLQRLMFETVAEIGRIADEQSIDCHFERSGALEIAVNPLQLERLKAELSRLRGLGFTEEDFRCLDAGEIRRELPVEGALAAIYTPQSTRRAWRAAWPGGWKNSA